MYKSKAEKIEELKNNIEKTKNELNKLSKNRENILKDIEQLQYSEEKYNEIEEKYNKAQDTFTQTKTLLSEKTKTKQEHEKELNTTKKEKEELENKIKKLKKIINFTKDLEKIRQAFSRDGIQKILRQRIAPIISEFARKYIESFNLDITDILLNEDFDISIIKEGEEISIKSISGGEKVAVAIALRLAIAKALAGKISTIIMDEPTTHLDQERRKELIEIMKNFFKEGTTIPQMIIVTHHRELEEIADTIYQVEKTSGTSKITEITLT